MSALTAAPDNAAVAARPPRLSWDEWFLSLADMASRRATCLRAAVGAVLVNPDDHTVVGLGYNGAPPGADHCLDVGCLMVDGHCKRTRHAEENVLAQAGDRARGAVLYLVKRNSDGPYGASVGVEPCADCAALLAEAGVQLAQACGGVL